MKSIPRLGGRFYQISCLLFVSCLLAAPLKLHGQIVWIQHTSQADPVPRHTIVASKHGMKFFVCRAQLHDGVHAGESDGKTCFVPYLGKALSFEDFEFATARRYSWGPGDWSDGVIAGQQKQISDLYVCRAHIAQDAASKSFASGKAYKVGPHAGHCYVPFKGKEIDFDGGFELLHISAKNHSPF